MKKLVETLARILGRRRASDAQPTVPEVYESDGRRLVALGNHLCGITDVGRVREHNEDGFHLSPDGCLLVVADGMGGHQAGDVASAMAVATLAEFFDDERCRAVESGEAAIELLLPEAFKLAHERVLAAAKEEPDRTGMGTTLIAAFLDGSHAHVCHVGDVRCYHQSENGLEQLTEDHSVVGALVRAGQLTPEEARVHQRKNELLQAVGLRIGILPDVQCVELGHGDRLLLCSDGLWEALPDEEIQAILDWEGSARQRATQLVDRANAAGGNDNITVVLYEHPDQEA